MSSTLSTVELQNIVERLKLEHFRNSTRNTYHQIWKLFASFFLRLDYKPISWQERVTLFIGHLIESNLKSSSIKSYISAICAVLAEDGITFQQDDFVLTSLVRASKFRNDVLIPRLPIHKDLLLLIQKETMRYCNSINQPYLHKLYLAIFTTAYYRLLRIGEVTQSNHVLLA